MVDINQTVCYTKRVMENNNYYDDEFDKAAFRQISKLFDIDPAEFEKLAEEAGPGMTYLPDLKFSDGTVLPGRKL